MIQTVLSSSPERKRERETIRHDVVPYLKFMHTKPKKTLLPSLQVSPVARALSITPRVPSSPGDSIVNFVEEEEAGLQEGTDPTRTTPQFSKKHAIRKKKCLILSVHLWLSVGQTCRTFTLPSHPLPPPLATWYTCICMIFEFSM